MNAYVITREEMHKAILSYFEYIDANWSEYMEIGHADELEQSIWMTDKILTFVDKIKGTV